jgi:hypothetical protein
MGENIKIVKGPEVVDYEPSVEALKLRYPLLVNGENIRELNYNLEDLTSEDMDKAAKFVKQTGDFASVIELDPNYHISIFRIAVTKQHPEITMLDLKRLKAKDHFEACKVVRNFFMSDSEDSFQETTEGES